MYTVNYNHKSDLLRLLDLRGLPSSLADNIPEIGRVVVEDGKVIAMGFLRRIEGKCGLVDGYITDPHETSDYRDQALDLLTSGLIETAKSLGMERLFEISAYEGIHKRAMSHGFSDISGMKTLILSL